MVAHTRRGRDALDLIRCHVVILLLGSHCMGLYTYARELLATWGMGTLAHALQEACVAD